MASSADVQAGLRLCCWLATKSGVLTTIQAQLMIISLILIFLDNFVD